MSMASVASCPQLGRLVVQVAQLLGHHIPHQELPDNLWTRDEVNQHLPFYRRSWLVFDVELVQFN